MALIEIFAALCGLAGTLLLATKGRYAGWGFVAYLVSNAGWLMVAWSHDLWAMFVQQIGFVISSLAGIWIWLIAPRRTGVPGGGGKAA
jgi:nicotinamide riboside transporter PnuC